MKADAMRTREFIPCLPKPLPVEHRLEAARIARLVNPHNHSDPVLLASALVSDYERLAITTARRWPSSGKSFSVCFLDNPPRELRRRVLAHMNAWSEWANVRFFESHGSGEVRIARDDGCDGGIWSYVGTEILLARPGEPTMNLEGLSLDTPESEFRRVVRHVTGHVLGLPHEHLPHEEVERIDAKLATEMFGERYDWSAEEVRRQLLTPLSEYSILGTEGVDYTSIMSYQVPGSITKDGRPIVGGLDIHPIDGELVGRIYPKCITGHDEPTHPTDVERPTDHETHEPRPVPSPGSRDDASPSDGRAGVTIRGSGGVLYFGGQIDPEYVARVIAAVERHLAEPADRS